MKRIITLLLLVLQTFFSFSQEKPEPSSKPSQVVLDETVGYEKLIEKLSQEKALKPPSTPYFDQRTVKPDGTSGGINIKGDITFIANNVLSIDQSGYDPEDAYDGSSSNGSVNMQYIDIDNDASTFSSSSDVLNLPTCSRVVYAGLYWAGVYPYDTWGGSARSNDFNKIKFKLPGGAYQDIEADASDVTKRELIYDNGVAYICYKDITADIQGLASVDPEGHNGTYVAANIRATRGNDPGGLGGAGGWTMVVIYENQTESSKNIAVFDGFADVRRGNNVDLSYSGFITVPVGPNPTNPAPVRAKLLAAALEGDRSINWDSFQINDREDGTGNYIDQYTPNVNPRAWDNGAWDWRYNFFNGSISRYDAYVTTRTPNSENTLGFDVDLYQLSNPNNSVITNNQTSAHVRFTSNQDTYWPFLNALSVEIIEPELQMVKSVLDAAGNDIQGTPVGLGSELFYNISFQNVGTDDAKNTVITDRLPKNVDLLETSTGGTVYNGIRFDIDLPAGVTIVGYEAPSAANGFRAQVEFGVPDSMVLENGAEYNIRLHVQVVSDCNELRDVCSNVVENQAFARYEGVKGGVVVDNEPSYSGFDSCDFGIVGSSNFLVNLDDCDFRREEVLCGGSIELTAGDGFDTYSWVDENGNPLGNTQSITVTSAGVYTVTKTTTLGCITKPEIIEVISFANVSNPLAPPFADRFNTSCTSNTTELAEIYLCGNTTETRDITLPFAGSNTTVEWFKLNGDGGCGYNFETEDCAPTSTGCSWGSLGTDLTQSFGETGAYKLEVLYDGTCPQTYYFNVFRNSLTPTVVPTDILCGTDGSIVVNGVPDGYEYSLSGNGTTTGFQTSNTFSITNPGDYTVTIRQVGSNGSCNYVTDSVNIQSLDIDLNVLTNIDTCGGESELTVQIGNVPGKYSYEIRKDNVYMAGSNGFIDSNDQRYTITESGTYQIFVTTEGGCSDNETRVITLPEPITLSAITTKNITCENGSSPGIITLTPSEGTSPYEYAVISVNGTPVADADKVFFTDTTYEVPMGSEGTYVFEVRDDNNCSATAEATVIVEPALQFTATPTHIVCNGDNDGTIEVNLTGGDATGYTLEYSRDGFSTTNNTGVFSGLSAGAYTIDIRASKNTYQCTYQVSTTITEPEALSAEVIKERDYNCGAGGKVRFFNEQGGTGAYEYGVGTVDGSGNVTNIDYYSFDDNGSAEAVFNSLLPGTYRFYIRDENGCVYEIPGDIIIEDSPQAPQLVPNITYNCDGTGNVVLGPPSEIKNNFDYSLDGGSTTNINNFPNLTPGPHEILVYYKGQDCSTLVEFEIEQGQEFTAKVDSWENITCNGGSDGTITISAENYGTSYQYSLNGGTWSTALTTSPHTIIGLTNGTYSISVRSNVNSIGDCQVDIPDNVVLTQPDVVTVAAQVTKEITCVPNTGATITVTDTDGGNGAPYTHELLDSSGNPVAFTNVPEGSYNVVATDKDGCTSAPFPITVNSKEDLDFTVTPVQCFDGSNGTLTVNIGTGNGGYSYMIDGVTGWQNSNVFNNLTDGTYNVIVRDGKGCQVTESATILPQVTATIVPVSATCDPGQIQITPNGGDGNYQFVVEDAGGSQNTYTSSLIDVPAGTYTVYVRDKDGGANYCEFTDTVTVNQIVNPTHTTTLVRPDCNGGTGTINVVVENGTAPYTVTVTSGPTSVPAQTGSGLNYSFSGLTAGSYEIQVIDGNNCPTALETRTIQAPDALVSGGPTTATDLMCSPSGTILGTITFQVPTGGTTDYLYFYKLTTDTDYTQAGSTTVTNLDAGEYNTKVLDAKGCELLLNNVTIAPLPEVTLTVSPVTYNCDGTGNFTVTPNPAGSYTYTLGAISNNDGVFTNIPEGSHIVSVAIGSNCTVETDQIIVAPNQEFTATITDSSKTCIGSNDGTITIEAYFPAGTPTATFDYSTDGGTTWTNGVANPHTITGLPVGLNTIEVRPNNASPAACVVTLQETLVDPEPMVLTLPITKEVTCSTPTGATITPNVTGGYGGVTYSYELFIAPMTPTGTTTTTEFTDVALGDYVVVATDQTNGCTISNTVTVAPAESVAFDAAALCFDGTNGQIEISNITGNGDYSYSLNGSSNFIPITSDPFTISGLSSESYTVTVKDGKGCSEDATVVINNLLYATATPTNASCTPPTNPTGEISVTATGGDGAHEFAVIANGSPAPAAGDYSGTNPITGLAPGTYDVYVRDGSSCSYIVENVVIGTTTPVDITVVDNQPTCNGDTGSVDGQIVANTGQAPYTIVITNSSSTEVGRIDNFTGTNFSFNSLVADAYEITITDALNCTDTETITLVDPPALIATIVHEKPACGTEFVGNEHLFGYDFTGYPSVAAGQKLQFSVDNGVTWQDSPIFRGTAGNNDFNLGTTSYPVIRIVDDSAPSPTTDTTITVYCLTDLGSYTMPFEVSPLVVNVTTDSADCTTGATALVEVDSSTGVGPFEYTYNTIPVPPGPTGWEPVGGTPSRNYTFTGLIPGRTYYFFVRDLGDDNCTRLDDTYVVNIDVEITPTVLNQTCDSGLGGAIQFDIDDSKANLLNGGTPPIDWELFSIDVNTGVTTSIETGTQSDLNPILPTSNGTLASGTYYLILNNGTCTFASPNIEVVQGTPIQGDLTKVNDITCSTEGLVRIENVTGGFPGYTYNVITADNTNLTLPITLTSNTFEIEHTNVSDITQPVDIVIEVVDTNGCTLTLTETLTVSQPPTLTLDSTANCDPLKSITVTGSGGLAPYQYSIDGGAFTAQTSGSHTFTGLASGDHTIVVRDANGCEDTLTGPTAVSTYPVLDFNLTTVQNLNCAPGQAVIGIEITSGADLGSSGDFTYTVTPAATATPNNGTITGVQTSQNVTVTTAETYTVTVNDLTSGCSETKQIPVAPAVHPDFSYEVENSVCAGDNSGIIRLTAVDNGILPLTYEINHDSSTSTPAYNATLPAGDSVFTGLAPGFYLVTGTSGNGCETTTSSIEIKEFEAIILTPPTVDGFKCNAGTNTVNVATVTVPNGAGDISGGSGNYTSVSFTYTPNTGIQESKIGSSFEFTTTNTSGGTVDIIVYDDKGCFATVDDVVIPPFEAMIGVSANQVVGGAITCTTLESITVEANPNVVGIEYRVVGPGYNQAITGTGSPVTFTGLDTGDYTVTATHPTTGCVVETFYKVGPEPVYDIVVSDVQNESCRDANDGSVLIDFRPTGDYGDQYDFELFDANTGASIDLSSNPGGLNIPHQGVNAPTPVHNLPAGNYYITITMTASPNCKATTEIFTIYEPTLLEVRANVDPVVSCTNGSDATITATPSGGWGNYIYQLEDTNTGAIIGGYDFASNGGNNIFTNLASGEYRVRVRDGNGCTMSDTVTIVNPDPITFSVVENDNACNTSVGGSITVNAAGGTDTYVYSISGTLGYTATQTLNAGSYTFSNLPADTYTVNVVDSKGCPAMTAPIDVTINPDVNFSLVETKKIDCSPTPNGVVTVDLVNWTSGVSNYEYEVVGSSSGPLVNGSVTSDPFTISIPNGNPTPQAYTVTVRDMDSQPKPECEVSREIIINPRIDPVFRAQATVDNICSGSSTGEITVSETDNGISPLTYRINPQPTGWSFNNNVFSGLPAGTYTITAEGTNDCITSTDVTINENLAIDISNAVTFTQFNCTVGNETNSATIVVDKSAITGGTENYVRVEFIDTATGAVLYNGNNFTYTSTDEAGGTYTVNVYDENEGCFATEDVTINPFVKITGLTVDPQRKIDCNEGEDIIATYTTSTGNPLANFEFRLYDNAAGPTASPIETRTNTDGDFSQFLAPGTYRIELENLNTYCIETEYYVVGPVPSYDVFLTNIQRACFNGTGSVDFYFSPSTPYTDAFDYEVIPVGGSTAVVSGNVAAGAPSPTTISGIAPGEYYVQIRMTDSPFCTPRSVDFEISQPDSNLTLASDLTYLKCTPPNSGGVKLSASGGWGAYQYELVNNTSGSTIQSFDNNAIITGLTAGDYTATVRDVNGCTETTTFTLTPGTTITGDLNVTPNLCEGEYTATIEVTNIAGGQTQDPNLTYSYTLVYPDGTESASQSSPIFTNLPAGVGYSVKVADGYSCDGLLGPVDIIDPIEVVASAEITVDITCNTPQATVEVTGAGGTGPYMYSMDGVTFGNTNVFNVDAGVHQFYVRDSELCVSEPATITVGAYVDLNATLNIDSAFITCNGDSNAVLSADVEGGFANHEYQLLDGNNAPLGNWQPSNIFSGLDVGTYKINVRSTNRFGVECFAITGEHTISEPDVLEAEATPTPVTCFGGNDGTITVNPQGGNNDYEFNIASDPSSPDFPETKFVKNNVFENLSAGVYWITVKDVVGCYLDPIRVEVTQPEQFTVELGPNGVTEQVCIDDSTPTIELDVQGGTQPYYVSINNTPLGTPYTTNTIVLGAAENIQGGTSYFITVRDEAGCNVADPIRVTTGEPVDLQLTVDFEYTCPTGNIVLAIVDEAYRNSMSYTLYDGVNTQVATNTTGEFIDVPAGSGYYVTATHTISSCSQSSTSSPIDIVDYQPLTLEIDDSVKNTLIANADFGLEPYEYSVDGGDFGPDNEFLVLQTKDYTITVRDARGCEVTLTVRGEYISIFVPNLFTPDGDGINDYWYPREVEDYHDIKVFIYDRYARNIADFKGTVEGWDGTYEGTPLPSGDYWYTIYFKELSGQEKKIMGHFTLYR
ncbi:T9SS type B sorting domain-containing protein [Tenacibaculum sp. SDUM215027]|uniref:T9SS type B sorting domain-containing protein n=1 Tax=Tenacibaculum sp. SDUM215027 TaxID=3422596 RepID=UPI003D3143BF